MKRTILMLEHDEDDRYITQANLDELQAELKIDFVANSTDMFRKLEAEVKPGVLLIAYNSKPLSAMEILSKLKSETATAAIPVIVLSGLATPAIVRECYRAGAASFITKPDSDRHTTEKITTFLQYWFRTVELP